MTNNEKAVYLVRVNRLNDIKRQACEVLLPVIEQAGEKVTGVHINKANKKLAMLFGTYKVERYGGKVDEVNNVQFYYKAGSDLTLYVNMKEYNDLRHDERCSTITYSSS